MINYDYADGPAPGSSTSASPDPTHEGFWGRLKSFNFKNDTTYKNTYTYDGTGRLDEIKADHSTATVFDYTYHANANVVDYLQHGSYSQDVVYRSDSYLQDKLIHKWGTDLTKDQEARYTYDSLGRRSYEKTSGLVVEDLRPTKDRWGALTSYNDRNELTGYRLYEMNTSWSVSSTTAIAGTRQSYTLDHMGNRTGGHQNDVSGTYTSSNPHDGLNQYNAARGLTVDYDNAGNMTDYGAKDYVYDAEDRLVKVTVGTTHYKYKYDYLGRRIAKYTGSTLNKKFVYQGWNLIAELSSSGSVQRTFTWGLDVSTTLHGAGGVGGLLLIDDELTSKRYYPIYDGSRNITGLYDQDGALVASYEYDAFGRIILQSSGDYSDDNPFRFSTKYTDDETGLVYYGHRYYEPRQGRFINRDPIGEFGGLNLYGFVGNSPVNRVDYLGLDVTMEPFCEDEGYIDAITGEEICEDHPLGGLIIIGRTDNGDYIVTGSAEDMARLNQLARNYIGDDGRSGLVWDGQFHDGTQLGWDGNSFVVMDENSHILGDFGVGESVWVAGTGNTDFELIYGLYELNEFVINGNESQSVQRTRISIGYTEAAGHFVHRKNHSFVIITDPVTGDQHALRAGPSSGFVSIRAEQGIYNESFRDPPTLVHTTQQVGFVNAPFSNVVSWADEFVNVTNANSIPYRALSLNSNSFAFTFVDSLGFVRPIPLVPVPGWRSGRPDPSLSYLRQIQSAP